MDTYEQRQKALTGIERYLREFKDDQGEVRSFDDKSAALKHVLSGLRQILAEPGNLRAIEECARALVAWSVEGRFLEGIDYENQKPRRWIRIPRERRDSLHLLRLLRCLAPKTVSEAIASEQENVKIANPEGNYDVLFGIMSSVPKKLRQSCTAEGVDLSGESW